MRQAGLLTEPSDQDWEKANKSLLWPWAGDDRFKGIHVSYCIRKIPHVSYSSLPSQAKVFIGLSNYQQHMPTYERFPWTMIHDRCTLHTLHWAGQDGQGCGHRIRKRLQSDWYSLCLKLLCILHTFAKNSEHQQLIVLAFLSFQIGSPREASLWFCTQMKIHICNFVRNYTSRFQVHLSSILRLDVKILKKSRYENQVWVSNDISV